MSKIVNDQEQDDSLKMDNIKDLFFFHSSQDDHDVDGVKDLSVQDFKTLLDTVKLEVDARTNDQAARRVAVKPGSRFSSGNSGKGSFGGRNKNIKKTKKNNKFKKTKKSKKLKYKHMK